MISSENSESYIRKAYELGVSDYISRPFDAQVVFQRVFNTIKLYAKQRRLIRLVTNQIYEKEKNNRIMVAILSQIVEFRNGESGLSRFPHQPADRSACWNVWCRKRSSIISPGQTGN